MSSVENLWKSMMPCYAFQDSGFVSISSPNADGSFFPNFGTTCFFRHANVYKNILDFFKNKDCIHILVTASSIGCEAYSIALLFANSDLAKTKQLFIDCVDISPTFTDFARKGQYPKDMVTDMPLEYQSYFTKIQDSEFYQLDAKIMSFVNILPATNLLHFVTENKYDAVYAMNFLMYLKEGELLPILKKLAQLTNCILCSSCLDDAFITAPNDYEAANLLLSQMGFRLVNNEFIQVAEYALPRTDRDHKLWEKGAGVVVQRLVL